MRKHLFILISVMLVLGLASCAVDDNVVIAEYVNTITPSDKTEPTDDQMSVKVTADLSTYVPSAFDEGSTGAALVARLPLVTDDIQPDTRLVLLKGSDFEIENALPADEIREIARSYLNGAYIAIERPTRQQAANLILSLLVFITELSEADLQQNFSVDAAAAAVAVRQSRAVDRLKVRMENIERIGNAQNNVTTRGGETDTEDFLGEMLILGSTDYFLQQPLGANSAITFSEDSEGNVTDEQPVTATVNRTPYVSGKLADAAAQWLNEVVKPQDQKPLRVPTRADGNTAINDIMGASESFTYSGHVLTRDYDGTSRHYYDRVKTTIRSWGVHNMQTNKDYYYLTQGVRISLKKDTWWMDDDDTPITWWHATNYGDFNRWVGSFLSGYVTSMNLIGNGGDIMLEAALPTTDNNSTTLSVETGSSSSTTHTIGYSFGYNYGLSSGSGIGVGVNLGINESWGYTDGTSFALESTYYSNEWGVAKSTDGNKVTWTYKGSLPQFHIRTSGDWYYYEHDNPADILIKDCDMSNEICWSVANPVDQYTVEISSMPQTAALLYSNILGSTGDRPHRYEFTSENTNYSHTLLQPNRATQTWRMDVKIEEWENESVPGARSQLVAAIKEGFPDLYSSVFKVADKSMESMDMINYIVTYSKEKFDKNYERLQNYARELDIRKYSISWSCDEKDVQTNQPYVVDATPPAPPAPPATPVPHAQAVWCEGNKTLYFVNVLEIKTGDIWEGQTVTKVWADDEVLNTASYYRPSWNAETQGRITRVVFDKSFADTRPTRCAYWFSMLASLETIEGIENLNTSKVTSTAWMFHGCEGLETLDVSGFDMGNVTDANHMFSNCIRLRTIYCNQSWNISNSKEMFRTCSQLKGAVAYDYLKTDCSMANPETGYFTWPEDTYFITLNEKGSNSTLLKRYEGQTVVVKYNRTLTAKIDDDGNYVATPFTVCLPYDLDLAQAVNAGQAEIYTLAAVSSGQFVFAKLGITTLEAGVPYLVRVLKGSITLGGRQVVIKATRPKSTKVYSSLAQGRRGEGTEIGLWVGNFDYLKAADAADDNAFAMSSTGWNWEYFTAGGYASIPAFRSYLSSSSIEKKTYQSRFTE